jgi:hypothetical protein
MPKPPSLGIVTSAFGMRRHPITGVWRMHWGEDTDGTGNFAPVSGTVVFAGLDTTGHGFGLAVGIRETANPSRIWWTAHHDSLAVKVGYRVIERRTPIGPMGDTGAATGDHAHQEVRVGGTATPGSGTAVNPRPLYTTGGGSGAGGIINGPEEDDVSILVTASAQAGKPTYFVAPNLLHRISTAELESFRDQTGLVREDLGNADFMGAVTPFGFEHLTLAQIIAIPAGKTYRAPVTPSAPIDAAAVAALVIPAVVAALEPKFAAVNANIDGQGYTVTPT